MTNSYTNDIRDVQRLIKGLDEQERKVNFELEHFEREKEKIIKERNRLSEVLRDYEKKGRDEEMKKAA